MSRAEDLLYRGLKVLGPKPDDDAPQSVKKRYSEEVSAAVALAFAAELRERGLRDARPSPPGEAGLSGAERRMSGGIGAKKVDVTWSTEESGLLLAVSVKSINFRDKRTRNFQKNLTNRRSDMLFESVTLHRRFPYAVLAGFMLLDKDAATDGSQSRRSTFLNTHQRFKLFTGRVDPGGRDEQYERFYVVLHDSNPFAPEAAIYLAGEPEQPLDLATEFGVLIDLVAERNPDFYEAVEGNLRPVRH
jgi:hypothetical protein